jgi:hypothetical protein
MFGVVRNGMGSVKNGRSQRTHSMLMENNYIIPKLLYIRYNFACKINKLQNKVGSEVRNFGGIEMRAEAQRVQQELNHVSVLWGHTSTSPSLHWDVKYLKYFGMTITYQNLIMEVIKTMSNSGDATIQSRIFCCLKA